GIMVLHWLRKCFNRKSPGTARQRTRRPHSRSDISRLSLEQLESRLAPAVAFDPTTNLLSIVGDEQADTARVTVTASGYFEVTLNGQESSSDPSSASFDTALAGATSATVALIQLNGDSQDQLILDNVSSSGSLTVSAGAAAVDLDDTVSVAGSLTVSG